MSINDHSTECAEYEKRLAEAEAVIRHYARRVPVYLDGPNRAQEYFDEKAKDDNRTRH